MTVCLRDGQAGWPETIFSTVPCSTAVRPARVLRYPKNQTEPASPEQRVLWSGRRFWDLPLALWDDLVDVGLRSHYVASALVAPSMVERGDGLIINVASHAAGAGKTSPASPMIMPYSVAKAGLHRLTADMAVELTGTGVAVVEVWPDASKTEGVLAQSEVFGDLTGWVEPIVSGRIVAAMVAAGNWLQRSGEALALNELALELGLPSLASPTSARFVSPC